MDVNPIDVQKALKGINYPATKDDVLETAENNGADEEVIDALRGMDDREYSGPDQVEAALS